MKWSAIYCSLVLCLLFSALRASGQALAQVSEIETLNSNGVLAIKIFCYGYGSWYDQNDSFQNYEDYAGASIGGSSYHGCQLNDPNGQSNFLDSNGTFYGGVTLYFDLPITVSGTWEYWASFWLWMWPCDSNNEDCNVDYPYDDPWGYGWYANTPTYCELNGSQCEGPYADENDWTTYIGMEYAYSGDSPTGEAGTFYVYTLAIDVVPSTYQIDPGAKIELTAEASNNANFPPNFKWTQVSGPANQSGDSGTNATYNYTAPTTIEPSNSTVKLNVCIINLTSQPPCQLVTIDILVPSISISSPSPNILLADGQSTSSLQATITNGATNATATWTSSLGVNIPVGISTTYPAQAATSAFFSKSNIATDNIFATIQGSNPAIVSQTTSLTLVQQVTIASVSPASWTAGTTFTANITGTGFSANSTIAINSPTLPVTINSCTAPSNISIQCSLTIPPNLYNLTASQAATITVSTTTSGLTSPPATSNAISIAPVVYTYSISLLPSTSSLWYGSTSTITPVITCKTSNGAACAGNVQNPQWANFKMLSGPGAFSCTSNCSSTIFTDTALIAAPSQNATVQGCASVWLTTCATTNFTIPATSISLNPPTMPASLIAGKTQGFTASIQNEGTATGLTWTLTPSPSSAAPGTLTSATTAITVQGSPASGTSSNTYTAPNPITVPTTVTLNACMSANPSICATPVAITLQPAPTFSVTATNPSQTTPLSLGHSMSYTVNVAAQYGFTGPVTLTAGGLPAGVTANFSPAVITTSGSATLTLTSAYSTSTYIGNSTITVTGTNTGTSGSVVNSASFALTTQPLQYKGACGVQ